MTDQTDETRGPVLPKPVTDALRAAMADATFKQDTMKQFNDLVVQVGSLEQTIAYLRAENRRLEIERDRHRNEVMKTEARLDNIGERETAVKCREGKVGDCEQRTAVAVAVASELRGVFHTIFANNQVRREIQHKATGAIYRYGENGNSSPVIDETTETETEGPV